MSADILRRAASLMRQRAEAATQGPWLNRRGPGEHVLVINGIVNVETPNPREDRRHIASWHPAVALAVAESVDVALGWFDPDDCTEAEQAMHDALLKVARAYLGESA